MVQKMSFTGKNGLCFIFFIMLHTHSGKFEFAYKKASAFTTNHKEPLIFRTLESEITSRKSFDLSTVQLWF